ncbi:MAG: SRPBCC family protein [Candidatus Kariarchaeaceae archaeon]|jgi:uncharacterized protein YndB with AHSA1/START domain
MMDKFQLEVIVNSNLKKVWEVWTDSKLIVKWFPPEANIEPRLGGAYELFFDPNNHEHQSTLGCVITTFEINKKLGFNWKGPDMFALYMNQIDSLTSVMVTFTKHEDGILVHLEHNGWGEGIEWEKAKNWHRNQWEMELQSLKSFLES